MISFRCDHCGQLYRVSEERRGQSGLCRQCGQPLVTPASVPPAPRDLLPILSNPTRPVRPQGPELPPEKIVEHVEATFGGVQGLFRDPRGGAEILHVAPSAQRPTSLLLTCGMSRLRMAIPDTVRGCDRTELLLALPGDWNLNAEMVSHAPSFWPVQLLQSLARLPAEKQSWLGAGHLIPNGDPPRPYGAEVRFSAVLLLPPLETPPEFASWFPLPGIRVEFLAVVPLLDEEIRYGEQRGLPALLKRLDRARITERLQPNRSSVCGRRWWKPW